MLAEKGDKFMLEDIEVTQRDVRRLGNTVVVVKTDENIPVAQMGTSRARLSIFFVLVRMTDRTCKK